MRPLFAVVSVSAFSLFVSACTTERVETEFSALDAALKSADAKVSPLLAPGLEEARQAEITASAQAGDPWFLSDGCNQVLSLDETAPLTSCEVETVAIGDRAPAQNNATAAKRKLDTLRAYVAALELLMDSSLETEVTTSYSAALAAFGALGEATETVELVARQSG